MAKKRDCDRCDHERYLSELIYYKGFYFCPDCIDDDYKEKGAYLAAPKIKNFNPYLEPPGSVPGTGYGYNYGQYYGESL